ncbi:MAG: hypothetical protein KDA95_06715 [Acidimicrobiales bacterium]|nr:hypothetical protein [Acidimicrobiales bacterium]
MPELIEIEIYRQVAERAVGASVASVDAPDGWYIKGGPTPSEVCSALEGATISSTDRVGKLLLLNMGEKRPLLGLRFGMTGRLVYGEFAPIEVLEYSSNRDDPKWDRFALWLDDGTRLRISDPRRLGGVELDPDLALIGPDAWGLSTEDLNAALHNSQAPLKARLLDQSKVAGLGNLLVDETLWRAHLAPDRTASSLRSAEISHLRDVIVATIDDLYERGGSHMGDLQAHRHRDGTCPRCGKRLARQSIGGRTTYWCGACVEAAGR